MSVRHICDFPGCEAEAICRITEERYPNNRETPWTRELDACDRHRTYTHPGWWCSDAPIPRGAFPGKRPVPPSEKGDSA